MYLIFYFDKILCRLPFPSPTTTTLAYVIRASHTSTRTQAHTTHLYIISKNTQKKAQAANNYLDLLYVLKGFLDWSITHLTFYNPKLTYQCMLGIHHTFNFIYININILPTFIINPYTMQITFYIKVFFKS